MAKKEKKDHFFDEHGRPEFCYSYLPAYPDKVVIVKRGEMGYFKSDYTGGKEKAIELNKGLKVTEVQMECLLAGSMFGWTCPAAFPKLRTKTGGLKLDVLDEMKKRKD